MESRPRRGRKNIVAFLHPYHNTLLPKKETLFFRFLQYISENAILHHPFIRIIKIAFMPRIDTPAALSQNQIHVKSGIAGRAQVWYNTVEAERGGELWQNI